MIKRFQRVSLVKQIIYLNVLMLSFLLVSFLISNYIAQRIVEDKVTESVNKLMLQLEATMKNFYKDMDGISYSLLYSPTLQQYLSTNDALTHILMDDDIVSQFSSTLSLKEDIKGILLYNNTGKLIANLGEKANITPKNQASVIEYTTSILPNSSYYTISVPVYNLQNNIKLKDYRGMCVFLMDGARFNELLQTSKQSPHSKFLLLDEKDVIIAGTAPQNYGEVFHSENYSNRHKYLVQEAVLKNTGWKIISVLPKAEVLQDVSTIKNLNIATYIVIFSMLLLFLVVFYNQVFKPVKALLDFVKSYTKKGKDRRFSVTFNNEIGVLGSRLNQMLDDIDHLSRDIQVVQQKAFDIELMKKKMEISAYRNQINPHFLYNTLECIRAIALFHKAEDIAEITSSLSKMFRYSIKGAGFVSIGEELLYLREYSRIIDYRFRGKIQIRVEAEERLQSLYTLKLLLQPIVENAVFHGLETKVSSGLVTVQVNLRRDQLVCFTVKDDGVGMSGQRLEEVRAQLNRFEGPVVMNDGGVGIGLANIYRRIKLFYGENAQMTIESKVDEGTMVILTVPIMEEPGETEGELCFKS
ncbi:sensor with HAMP domain [Paenibacillus sp. FSL R7-277]|uniref:sensor histidine kinase n=1 Tax=Paenibacillus sp. FSL R7-277 TaxID=1227352 RepID=UPI0003E26D04|nr:sensor histidine kinase [Paenibacillus sp. FSL R7-277]ETT77633.1 sensor with HAMP domain [Paenibacillus sp. FSL R7-277]